MAAALFEVLPASEITYGKTPLHSRLFKHHMRPNRIRPQDRDHRPPTRLPDEHFPLQATADEKSRLYSKSFQFGLQKRYLPALLGA